MCSPGLPPTLMAEDDLDLLILLPAGQLLDWGKKNPFYDSIRGLDASQMEKAH